MGVNQLWKLLAAVGRRVDIATLRNKTLAVDVSIWLTQFVKAMRDADGNMIRNAHLLGTFRRVCKLLFHRIRPIFVFDGGTPALKRRTVLMRQQRRQTEESKLKRAAQRLLLIQLQKRNIEAAKAAREGSFTAVTVANTAAVLAQETAAAVQRASLAASSLPSSQYTLSPGRSPGRSSMRGGVRRDAGGSRVGLQQRGECSQQVTASSASSALLPYVPDDAELLAVEQSHVQEEEEEVLEVEEEEDVVVPKKKQREESLLAGAGVEGVHDGGSPFDEHAALGGKHRLKKLVDDEDDELRAAIQFSLDTGPESSSGSKRGAAGATYPIGTIHFDDDEEEVHEQLDGGFTIEEPNLAETLNAAKTMRAPYKGTTAVFNAGAETEESDSAARSAGPGALLGPRGRILPRFEDVDVDDKEGGDDEGWLPVLPSRADDMDLSVLPNLPPHLQKEYVEGLRKLQRQDARGKLLPVAAHPAGFSKTQIDMYVKSASLNLKIDAMNAEAAKKFMQGSRIAGDANREYLLTKGGKAQASDAEDGSQYSADRHEGATAREAEGDGGEVGWYDDWHDESAYHEYGDEEVEVAAGRHGPGAGLDTSKLFSLQSIVGHDAMKAVGRQQSVEIATDRDKAAKHYLDLVRRAGLGGGRGRGRGRGRDGAGSRLAGTGGRVSKAVQNVLNVIGGPGANNPLAVKHEALLRSKLPLSVRLAAGMAVGEATRVLTENVLSTSIEKSSSDDVYAEKNSSAPIVEADDEDDNGGLDWMNIAEYDLADDAEKRAREVVERDLGIESSILAPEPVSTAEEDEEAELQAALKMSMCEDLPSPAADRDVELPEHVEDGTADDAGGGFLPDYSVEHQYKAQQLLDEHKEEDEEWKDAPEPEVGPVLLLEPISAVSSPPGHHTENEGDDAYVPLNLKDVGDVEEVEVEVESGLDMEDMERLVRQGRDRVGDGAGPLGSSLSAHDSPSRMPSATTVSTDADAEAIILPTDGTDAALAAALSTAGQMAQWAERAMRRAIRTLQPKPTALPTRPVNSLAHAAPSVLPATGYRVGLHPLQPGARASPSPVPTSKTSSPLPSGGQRSDNIKVVDGSGRVANVIDETQAVLLGEGGEQDTIVVNDDEDDGVVIDLQEDEALLAVQREFLDSMPGDVMQTQFMAGAGAGAGSIFHQQAWHGATSISPTLLIEQERQLLANIEAEEAVVRVHARTAARDSDAITEDMRAEVMALLELFGVPYIVAPMEAEAQCAALELDGIVDGVITDDGDAFLFGSGTVYTNIFDDRKYVEAYRMQDVSKELGLDRDDLMRSALLLGSDYTRGVHGVGVVNAAEILRAFPGDTGLEDFRDWVLSVHPDPPKPSNKEALAALDPVDRFKVTHPGLRRSCEFSEGFPSRTVLAAYRNPTVTRYSGGAQANFTWASPDVPSVRLIAMEKFGWSSTKVDEQLATLLKELASHSTQTTMDNFFRVKFSDNVRDAKIKSRRLLAAVQGLSGRDDVEVLGVHDNAVEGSPGKRAISSPAAKPRSSQASIVGMLGAGADASASNEVVAEASASHAKRGAKGRGAGRMQPKGHSTSPAARRGKRARTGAALAPIAPVVDLSAVDADAVVDLGSSDQEQGEEETSSDEDFVRRRKAKKSKRASAGAARSSGKVKASARGR